MHPEVIHAMRFGSPHEEAVQACLRVGYPLRPDVCNRTFTIYLGSCIASTPWNTALGAEDVETCAKFLKGRCYRHFHGGQMEQVLDNLVAISFIRTPAEALTIIEELRKFDIMGTIRLEVEYVQGFPVFVKNY